MGDSSAARDAEEDEPHARRRGAHSERRAPGFRRRQARHCGHKGLEALRARGDDVRDRVDEVPRLAHRWLRGDGCVRAEHGVVAFAGGPRKRVARPRAGTGRPYGDVARALDRQGAPQRGSINRRGGARRSDAFAAHGQTSFAWAARCAFPCPPMHRHRRQPRRSRVACRLNGGAAVGVREHRQDLSLRGQHEHAGRAGLCGESRRAGQSS
mmetsp:Transcript_54550/g.157768  ORF Transcript_54550/g.157768 Transcript_54550/m.157768 type:complete len:211 (+) Transcript_54550:1505-2137(+)